MIIIFPWFRTNSPSFPTYSELRDGKGGKFPSVLLEWCAGWEQAGQTGAPQTSHTAALGNHRSGFWSVCTLKDVSPDTHTQVHCPCCLSSKGRVKTKPFFMVTFYIRMAAQSCMQDNFCNKNGSRSTVPSCNAQTRMASLPLTFVLCHHAVCVRCCEQPDPPSTSSCILTCFV